MHIVRSLSTIALTLAVSAMGMAGAQAAATPATTLAKVPATTPATIPVAPHTATSHPRPDAVTVPAQDLAHFSHLLNERRESTAANQTSTNWSGYAATGSTYTSVSSSWVEPSVSCTSDGIVAFWIGLDGWGSTSVEQDGTGVDCTGGSPEQFAWWETYPANSIQEYSNPVSAGDSLTSTVTSEGGGRYDMVLTDSTRGWTENNTVSASGAENASAEIIAEAVSNGSSVTPLPNFGSVSFSASTIDNGTLQAANAQAINMTNSSGTVIATTGADSSTGAFTIEYGNSTPPSGNTVTLTSPGNQSTAVSTAVNLQISGTDSAGAALSYSASGLPTGLSISRAGLISGTPTTAGTYSVTVSATDTTGATGSASFTWTVTSGGGTCTGLTAWSATTSYVPGNVISYGGDKYTSTWYSTGAVPSAPTSWDVWTNNGAC